jgi:type IV secretory pathway TraG/TraD family ATPase VirD4
METLLGWLRLPWYSYIGLVMVLLFVGGMFAALVRLIARAMDGIFDAAWTGARLALWALTGWPWLQPHTYGTAYWAWRRHIHQAHLFGTEGIPLGTWKGRPLHESSGGHVALFGPPRSWKSTGCIMPTIRQHKGSVVVNDLRGELYRETHESRETLGPVFRFAPEDKDSACLNILDSVAWQTDEEFSDVHRLVEHLIPQASDEHSPFRVHAIPLLLALTIYAHRQGEGHLPGVKAWMDDPAIDLDTKLETLLAFSHDHVQAGARGLLSLSPNMRYLAWGMVSSALTVFANPRVRHHTMTSDVLFDDLLYGSAPVSLYLCFKLKNIHHMAPLFSTIVDTMVAVLADPPSPPTHRMLLCLDEAANLGRLPQLEQAVSYLQGSGTTVLLAFQNLAQVHQRYGEQSPLLASIGCQVHYRPHDVLTAEHIAGHLGQATVTSVSQSAGTGGVTIGEYHHARPLLFPDEILRLHQHQAIVLKTGCAPIRCTKLGVDSTPHPSRIRHLLHTTRQSIQYRPWTYATAAGCLLLAVMLWPVVRHLRAFTAPPSPSTAAPSTAEAPVAQPLPSTGEWVFIKTDYDTQGKQVEVPARRYATAAECFAEVAASPHPVLVKTYKRVHATMVETQRQPDRVHWTVTMQGQRRPQQHGVWCEYHARVDQK